MKKIFTIALLIFLLASCKDVVQVDLKQGEKLLVVDAFLNDNNTTQTVRLTTTDDYFSNANTPALLGATVSLNDITSNKSYSFMGDGNGNYLYSPLPTDTMAVIGHSYQLSVSYNGSVYNAISKCNRTTSIDTIIFKDKKNGPVDTTQPKKYFPYLIARDAPGATDYYWIKCYKNGVFYNGPGQIDVVQDAGGAGTDGIFFIPPNAFFQLTPGSNPLHLGDTCKIEIYGITSDTYDFFQQLQTQMTNSQAGLFATAPENVRTNVSKTSGDGMKAIGWFSIGAIKSKIAVAH